MSSASYSTILNNNGDLYGEVVVEGKVLLNNMKTRKFFLIIRTLLKLKSTTEPADKIAGK